MHHDHTTPEQRIAADLGLTTADLEQIVRHERAVRLAPRMVRIIRDFDHGVIDWNDVRAVLRDIDRPLSERRAS